MNTNTNNSAFDFNTAEKQTSFELIPDKTIVPVMLNLRAGGKGDGGWLKESKTSDNMMLDCEFIVTEGEYYKRKFWQYMVIQGSEKAVNISRKTLRAIIESARAVQPDDITPEAQNNRKISGYGDLNGLCFPVKVGIEKAQAGTDYKDKNKILVVITPDMPEYFKVTPPADAGGYSGGYSPQQTKANGYAASAGASTIPKVMPNWLKKPAQAQEQAA